MEEKKAVTGYMAVSVNEYSQRAKILQETFRGEVTDKEVRFPKGLGAEHPFDFSRVEKINNNIGIVNAATDKIVDAVVGDFSVTVKDANGQKILDSFIDNSSFYNHMRPWVKEAVLKGSGIMELDLDEDRVRVMSANYMYMRRNIKSKIIGWNQYTGKFGSYVHGKTKVIPFKPSEIAYLPINKIANDPYGIGLVWPNRVTIENYASSEIDNHKLLSRKAGAPYHVKIGQPGESVQPGDIDDFKGKMQYMNNSTEWVTDGNIDIKVLDFTGIGDNLIKAAEHDLEQLAIGMKIPMSLFGVSNNPEGLAKVNDNGFKRFINSVRLLAEEVMKKQIFEPVLRKNSMSFKIDFNWEMQDDDDKNERLKIIIDTLRIPFGLSPELRAGLEIEYANIVGLDEVINVLPDPKTAKEKADKEMADTQARETEEQTIKQPEVPGAKPTANSSAKQEIEEVEEQAKIEVINVEVPQETEECACCNLTEAQLDEMSVAEYVNLQELEGFNYTDYLIKILQNLRTEKFNDLRALTELDLLNGMLPKSDIDKLRVILKDGFRKNKTINQIEKDIAQSIDLKDRSKLNEEGERVITLSSERRPNMIARTETVRLANAGLKDMYQENDIKSYRYLAALDDRTSQICSSLNGQVFLTKDAMPGVNMPPMHSNCRSSIVGLVD